MPNGLVATRGQLRLEHPLPHGPRSRHGGRWCHLPADTEASRRTVEKGPHACGWGAVGHGLRAPTPATSSATARVTNAAPGQDLRLPTPPTPLEVRCRPPPGSGQVLDLRRALRHLPALAAGPAKTLSQNTGFKIKLS